MNCDEVRRKLSEHADAEALRHVRDCESCADAIVVDALTQRPKPVASAGFAARIQSELPSSPRAQSWPRAGVSAAIGLLVLIAIAVMITGSLTIHNRLLFGWLVILLGVELAALMLWLGRATRM